MFAKHRIVFGAAVGLVFLALPPFMAASAQSSRSTRDPRPRGTDNRGDDSQQRADTTFAIERGATLDVSAISASIVVRGWSRSEMQIRGGTVGLRVTNASRTVRVEMRNNGRGHDDDNLELIVPRGTRVLVNSRQGDVKILDVGGAVDATMISGDVTITGSAERSDVSVASGDVHVTNADGPVHIDAISGDISLDDIRGDVEVSATSSGVTMRRVTAARVSTQLVSGDVSFDGPLASNGRYEFVTHAGDVRLYLPDGSKGGLEVQTFNGEVHTDIPMTTTSGAARPELQSSRKGSRPSGSRGPQRFEFGGGGSAQIVISTFTGDVHLARGPRRSN
jgi:hypothetical protein